MSEEAGHEPPSLAAIQQRRGSQVAFLLKEKNNETNMISLSNHFSTQNHTTNIPLTLGCDASIILYEQLWAHEVVPAQR